MIVKQLRKVLHLLPLLLSAAIWGCGQTEEEIGKEPSFLRVQADNQRPNAFTTSVRVTVSCDIQWSADVSDKSWAKIGNLTVNEGTGGSFTLTLSPNTGKSPRENIIKVTAGTGETTATIIQEGLDAFFQPSVITLSGTTFSSVKFSAPYDWTAEIASGEDWILLSTNSGKAGTSTITCRGKDENKNVGSREGAIRVRIGSADVEIPVVQNQWDVILGDDSSIHLDWEGGTFTVLTQSNVDYEISSDDDWIEHTETRSLNEAVEVFFAKPNETGGERFTVIRFKGRNQASMDVLVFQNPRDPCLDLTKPGFYGIHSKDYIYGEDGWNQSGVQVRPDGSRTIRLMNRAVLSVISVAGIPASVTKGSQFDVTLLMQKKDRVVLRETVPASVIGTSEDLAWVKTESGICIIIKK